MSQPVPSLDALFAPWLPALGKDALPYRNHVERLLAICMKINQPLVESELLAFRVAAVFHDLGIWSDGTFDYLPPSRQRALDWLQAQGLADKVGLVEALIENHHKIRAAGDHANAVEVFRRADWMDVSLGLINFGLPRAEYRAILKTFPDAGFHKRLLQLGGKQMLTKPWQPLPMMRW
ncbi:MAG: hypothetical protein ACRERR_08520 [Moraxellaceae bacterium]